MSKIESKCILGKLVHANAEMIEKVETCLKS